MRYLLALLLSFNCVYAAEAPVQDYVVATIGEQKIYYSEIEMAAQGLNKFLKENFDTVKSWKLDFVRQYVARAALTKRAEREGLDKDKDIQFELEQARRGILSDKLLFRQLDKVKMTEESLRKYYEQNKGAYQEREKAKFSYIKVKTKEEADRIMKGVSESKSFERLCGKDMVKLTYWNTKSTLFSPELKGVAAADIDGLFSLKKSGVSQPIAAEEGFYIFRADEKEEAKDLPFEKAKGQVEIDYKQLVQGKAVNDYIKDTFIKENVVINEADIK
ncbi:MAG: peptidyl-prolyl cis-trans isomerase [Candidatus Omnitrophota bacterium]|jgi:parvulin-like peptidyl-prolyl isomerase